MELLDFQTLGGVSLTMAIQSGELTALRVSYQNDSVLLTGSLRVKDATSIMSQDQNEGNNTTPSEETNSAEDAAILYHLPPEFASHNVSVKCTKCDRSTLHEFVVVKPEPEVKIEGLQVDPMDILRLAKRLKVCTACGKMTFTD